MKIFVLVLSDMTNNHSIKSNMEWEIVLNDVVGCAVLWDRQYEYCSSTQCSCRALLEPHSVKAVPPQLLS